MAWLDRWRKKPAPPAPPAPAVAGIGPQPIVVNPSPDQEHKFALYRIEAICRDREQRLQYRQGQHREHHQMSGEAMMYAGKLMAAGLWTGAHMARLRARLGLKG